MESWAFLVKHVEGIAAYCFHAVGFDLMESLNTTIRAVIRRAAASVMKPCSC
jgi:hypothetical protein